MEKLADIVIQLPTIGRRLSQPPLFPSAFDNNPRIDLSIPANITNMSIGKSEQAPLIFWALIALKKAGYEWASGTEITDIINDYLVDDHNKKAPNNISRALRSEFLLSQTWLVKKFSTPRKKMFGVVSDWEQYWLEIFGEPISKND